MLRSWPDLHGQTKFFEAPNEPSSDLGFVSVLEVVGTEFVVRGFVFQNVVRRRQDGGGHGENRLLGSARTLEAKKLRAEVGVPRAGRHPSNLDERRFEPRVAGSRPRREPLAGTFLLARCRVALKGERLKPGELGSLLALLNFPIQTWIPTSECAL